METVSRETGQVRWVTDRGLMVACGTKTLSLYRRLIAAGLHGIKELVPADGSMLVVLESGGGIPDGLLGILNSQATEVESLAGLQHLIPTHFDGEDLDEVAEKAGLTVVGLIELVCSLDLGVSFLGFQPGFAYLEGLPPSLCLPRLTNPRKRVPAGSVALAGGYCGIYPAAGPGGWHLIGTTEVRMFNPEDMPPARLQPGDIVRLVPA